YGALLLAAYDKSDDVFRTVCKCGSGFTDEDLNKLPKLLEKYGISHPHARVDSKVVPDVWFVPGLVLEIVGAEVTLSPIHTCGMNRIRPGAGLAIRFPRFTGKYREDKSAEDCTTTDEVVKMYRAQLKKIEGIETERCSSTNTKGCRISASIVWNSGLNPYTTTGTYTPAGRKPNMGQARLKNWAGHLANN